MVELPVRRQLLQMELRRGGVDNDVVQGTKAYVKLVLCRWWLQA